jgi:hypothetical protein
LPEMRSPKPQCPPPQAATQKNPHSDPQNHPLQPRTKHSIFSPRYLLNEPKFQITSAYRKNVRMLFQLPAQP